MVAHQDDRARDPVVVDGDLLQQADVERIAEERMEVEQRIHAWLAHTADVTQRRRWFERAGQGDLQVGGLPAARQRPRKHLQPEARSAALEQLDRALLLLRLDDDDRESRRDQELEFVLVLERVADGRHQAAGTYM